MEDIGEHEIRSALYSLSFFESDFNLRSQAFNLGVVDQFIMQLEYDYLYSKINESNFRAGSSFLAAQSQMWIFYCYEIMRSWTEKVKSYIKLMKNGGVHLKLADLQSQQRYMGIEMSQKETELQMLIDNQTIEEELQRDLDRTYMLFTQIEMLRIQIAKHQMRKRPNVVVEGATIGMMNRYCGSLDYQINSGLIIMGSYSRRDLAEGIRSIPTLEVPSQENLDAFNKAMRGPSQEEIESLLKGFN